jgi:type II secretory ATPase GspE/PulE/Tfp pilus assembly ATPase PilB-like protein
MSNLSATLTAPDVAHLRPHEVLVALIEYAAQLRCSDLFLATQEDHVAVAVRRLGLVHPLLPLPLDLGQHCIAHVKVMAGMDVSERRRPQDGRWLLDRPGGRIDLRISTIPTLHGQDCCLRLMVRETMLRAPEELGLNQGQLNDLLGMLTSPSGLLLVGGPTGSGKTTTLYACLAQLNDGTRKINTIEDPIEYEVPGIRQSQINPRIDLGFAEMLRGVMRQAPTVIMLGEIRDAVTAATAVHAANSGHLVLATLHAPIAAGAVQSLRAWGVHSHFLASCLLGVIAQRLVRTLCRECRTEFPLAHAPYTFDEVRPWLEPGEGLALYAARGCPGCHGTGYAGRTGVFEMLRITSGIRRRIADGATTQAIREQAVRDGMVELRHAALLKVARGQTTVEEVVRHVPVEYLGLEE